MGIKRKPTIDRTPPRPGYITPEGFERIKEEIRHLWEVERPRVTLAVQEAAALGDRSENAEYLYGKKRLRAIDGRLHYLTKRLDHLTVVQPFGKDEKRVLFGAWVKLEGADGKVLTYQIVGPDETDMDAGKISIDSPMGRAMMRKEIGEEFTVQRPMGDAVFTVLEVRYDAPQSHSLGTSPRPDGHPSPFTERGEEEEDGDDEGEDDDDEEFS